MDYPISLPQQLSTYLRSLRKARGLKQSELAELLGVAQSRVAAIERNPGAVSMKQLIDVVRALGGTFVLRDLKSGPPAGTVQSKHTQLAAEPQGRYGVPTGGIVTPPDEGEVNW